MPEASPKPDWDARYAAAEHGLFGEAPCAWLEMVCTRSDFAPRTALLPADGDGRNGTWLAARGVTVTGLDLSREATRRAVARDTAAGVKVERVTANLVNWSPQPGRRWDASLVFYLQGPRDLRQQCIATSVHALAPGGWFVLEGFAKTPAPSIGPENPDNRYDLDETLDWLNSLEIIEALSGQVLLDEGTRHQGAAQIIRILARKAG